MHSYHCSAFIALGARGHADTAKYTVSVRKEFTVLSHVSYTKPTRAAGWLASFSAGHHSPPRGEPMEQRW